MPLKTISTPNIRFHIFKDTTKGYCCQEIRRNPSFAEQSSGAIPGVQGFLAGYPLPAAPMDLRRETQSGSAHFNSNCALQSYFRNDKQYDCIFSGKFC